MLDINDIIDSKELSKMLHVSRGRIYQLCYEKSIPHYHRPGLGYFFLKSEIMEWMKDGRVVTVRDAIQYYFKKNRNVNGNRKTDGY